MDTLTAVQKGILWADLKDEPWVQWMVVQMVAEWVWCLAANWGCMMVPPLGDQKAVQKVWWMADQMAG